MNTINFSEVGGFPMTTNILGKMQTSYLLTSAFGNIMGDKSIISGCTAAGSNTTDGVVFFNNEVFEFRGGLTQSKVVIKEETEKLLFQNNTLNPVIKTRYVTFGTGIGAIEWAEFKRGFPTKDIGSLIQRIEELEARPKVGNIPIGLIAMWQRPANEIPEGWEEETLFKGKFPRGFDADDSGADVVGKVGGSKEKLLSESELPVISPINGKGIQKGGEFGGSGGITLADNGTGDYPPGSLIKPFGGGQPFSILNPYRIVHFIKYVG
ncbi:hypothetical protein SGQ83_01435 [Flavobacterium sp. Fl-318]|uniref:Tail fiber protein n=1 Tax=Flavobacterium cupriresistens TaxID=2893885 RepID=A0ABU4R7J0_9FLAO|nr:MULTISPECIES: hypothetical protein [unclassified Flavobacterium]MDX6187998.1 hypothetical protein [Flavobacterium sp. Fl-318]UFH42082.1 hypothetical protein LNP23_20015 [Flavobacterium sp. F-323]